MHEHQVRYYHPSSSIYFGPYVCGRRCHHAAVLYLARRSIGQKTSAIGPHASMYSRVGPHACVPSINIGIHLTEFDTRHIVPPAESAVHHQQHCGPARTHCEQTADSTRRCSSFPLSLSLSHAGARQACICVCAVRAVCVYAAHTYCDVRSDLCCVFHVCCLPGALFRLSPSLFLSHSLQRDPYIRRTNRRAQQARAHARRRRRLDGSRCGASDGWVDRPRRAWPLL